jgi:peptidoglycan/LPS O-acetylase OafA/YrhL
LAVSRGRPSGFDYLRIILSLAVIGWHTIIVCYGRDAETPFWTGWFRPLPSVIVPAFFALSGFLVAGSLVRNSLPSFLTLRGVRIFPALAVEVLVSALLIGPFVTTYRLSDYFSDPLFFRYFFNLIGHIQYLLPGVFAGMPCPDFVNIQLWTIPKELECYILISLIGLTRLHLRPWTLLFALIMVTIAILGREFWTGIFPALNDRPPGGSIVMAFLFGVALYQLKDKVPFHWSLALISFVAGWLFLCWGTTTYLSTLPVAYLTVYIGLLNPRISLLTAAADYSYGMYLYGFPVQQTVAFLFPSTRLWYANLALSVLISGVLAYLSWTFVESKAHAVRHDVVGYVQKGIEKIRLLIRGGAAIPL